MTSHSVLSIPIIDNANHPTRVRDRLLDNTERLLILSLYLWLAARLTHYYVLNGNILNYLILISEGLVLVFTLIRRPPHLISRHPSDWLLAITATCLPMMVVPGERSTFVPQAIGAAFLVVGIILQLHAKVSLGRSFGCVPANRGIKSAGPYQYIRHPIYLGYLLTHLGFLLVNPVLWNFLIYSLSDGLQIPRMLAEEKVLTSDPNYLEYKDRVKYRLVPGLF